MTELQMLIREQRKDMKSFTVCPFIENQTLIRPNLYRFADFAGESPKEKAYSVLRYLGWKNKDIIEALRLSLSQITEMQTVLSTTVKPDNYQKFFVDIPNGSPRKKAAIILRALWWKGKDVCEAISMPHRTYYKLIKDYPMPKRCTSAPFSKHPKHINRK